MDKNKHLIEKVFLEVSTNSMKVANSLKNSINMFCTTELFELIEQELELLFLDENQTLQIEKLELSMDNILFENDSLNTDQIRESIKKQLFQKIEFEKNLKTPDRNLLLSQTEKNANTLIYFLDNGVMPWWATKKDNFDKQDIDSFINSEYFKNQFQNIISKAVVQKRVIKQFSTIQLAQIIAPLSDYKTIFQDNKVLYNLNLENDFRLKENFWTTVFQYLKDKNRTSIVDYYFDNKEKFNIWKLPFEKFISDIKQIIPFNENDIPTLKKQIFNTEKLQTVNPDLKNQYYIQNAGLIIIHPFIKDLLRNCNLINEGNTIVDKELAVHILHYTATKTEQDYEHNMIFEKFLCGIPIHQPIRREILICDAHKKQVEEMLQSVLEHWDALKSNSTNLLRNEFLQREGKLDFQDNNPRLFVEKKTQDILLEKIPWNISVTKIPWIEKLIYTDW
jgi:hypothetical protein